MLRNWNGTRNMVESTGMLTKSYIFSSITHYEVNRFTLNDYILECKSRRIISVKMGNLYIFVFCIPLNIS